jgi:histidinol-phosphate aminotransferase
MSSQAIAAIAQSNPGLVVVDEAYTGFGAESALELVDQYDNLLLTRTLSKGYSLAGIRLGFAIGSEGLIEALYRIKDSYNVNILSQEAGIAVFQNHELFQNNFNMIRNNREYINEALHSLGFECTDSSANFVFCRHGQKKGLELYHNLKQKGILIRHFDEEPIQEWLRITVGSMHQIKALIKALKDELA